MQDKKNRSDIRFGTDGWRAEIANDYTFDNVRKAAQAIADYVNQLRTPKSELRTIIVGYDRRFLSDTYAKIASEVLAANNIKVLLSEGAVPTPAVSFAIKMRNLSGGIVITASHNPPQFNGIKFKTALAAPADEHATGTIEGLIGKNRIKRKDFKDCLKSKKIEVVDIAKGYIGFLRKYVDIRKIRASRPRVFIDYMHGVGAGYIEAVLGKEASANIETVRSGIDPLFGGVNPEPIPKNLEASLKYIKGKRFDLGVALDGDADRIGAMRPDGSYITSGQIISLILLHFLEDRNLYGKVAKTISGTTLIERICARFGLTLFELPVGFKNISSLMLKENILIGGEESGGIGFCGYIPERDGILSALLLMEMMAERKKPIIPIMDEIEKRYGRFCYDRLDIRYPIKKAARLTARLKAHPPLEIAGKKIEKMKTYDGIKFIMKDSSWLLLRFSGTEPLMRIYAESHSRGAVRRLLAAGKRLIGC